MHPVDADNRPLPEDHPLRTYPKHVYNGAKDKNDEPIFRAVNNEKEENEAADDGFDQAEPPKPAWAEEAERNRAKAQSKRKKSAAE